MGLFAPNKKVALKELNNKYNELININDGGVENFAKSFQKNESLVGLYQLFKWIGKKRQL